MFKMYFKNSIFIFIVFLLSACNGSPHPSIPGNKPTVFVKSNTPQKFKNLTEATAVWNGISPFFIKNKQYMRCDMTIETMVMFQTHGFEVVANQKDADYTAEITLLSCGEGYKAYLNNRTEVPLKQKPLYKDFSKWVNETDPSKLPSDAKYILNLISKNDSRGFEMFYRNGYIPVFGKYFDDTEYWQYDYSNARNYIRATKGVVFPAKYYNMPNDDKEALEYLQNKFKLTMNTSAKDSLNTTAGSLDMIGSGANLMSNPTTAGLGKAGIAIGVLGLFMGGSVSTPSAFNEFKITNNKTKKSWKRVMNSGYDGTWRLNTDKPIWDWTIDEVPWNEIDK